jgi:hypothetical protein
MCCIDGQENKYSVLNECSRMLKYNMSFILHVRVKCRDSAVGIATGYRLDDRGV